MVYLINYNCLPNSGMGRYHNALFVVLSLFAVYNV